jgi:hypothetical protein
METEDKNDNCYFPYRETFMEIGNIYDLNDLTFFIFIDQGNEREYNEFKD